MKELHYKILFPTLFFISISFFSRGQEYLNKELKPIKENFRNINLIKNWAQIKRIDLLETTEGGEATFYYLKGKLKKISVKQYGETFQEIIEYYLLNGKLSFVFNKRVKYNRPMYYDSTAMKENNDDQVWDLNKSEVVEDRSYFKNGNLLHQLNDQDCGSAFSIEYLIKEGKRIMTEFQRILSLGKKQN